MTLDHWQFPIYFYHLNDCCPATLHHLFVLWADKSRLSTKKYFFGTFATRKRAQVKHSTFGLGKCTLICDERMKLALKSMHIKTRIAIFIDRLHRNQKSSLKLLEEDMYRPWRTQGTKRPRCSGYLQSRGEKYGNQESWSLRQIVWSRENGQVRR